MIEKRIGYVDGLRALAVLAVLVHHTAKYDPTLSLGGLYHALLEGSHGVDLFFVVSGFCLSYPFLARLHEAGRADFDLAAFFSRRLIRIIPPYYAAIALFALMLVALNARGLPIPNPAMSPSTSLGSIGAQLVFWDRSWNFVDGSFWTLAIEMRWYVLFPLLLLLWARSPRAYALVGLCCLVLYHLTSLRVLDIATLPAFMLGVIAAEAQIRGGSWRNWSLAACIACTLIAVALEPKSIVGFYRQTQFWWQLAAFWFVVAAGAVTALRSILSTRPLMLIGLASYSIYLMHEPVVAFLQMDLGAGPVAAGIAGLCAGLLFYYAVERYVIAPATKNRWLRALAPLVKRAFDFLNLPGRHSVDLRARVLGEGNAA